MNLFKHPGNLGSVRGSPFTVHHYDWPTYPTGEDFLETLLQLTGFPKETEFVEVEDGDGSILFIADIARSKLSDPFNECNFHVCAWHGDLAEMCARGFVEGVTRVSESGHRQHKWDDTLASNRAEKVFFKVDGELIEITPPVRDYEEEESLDWVVLPTKRITVTRAGFEFIAKEIESVDVDFLSTLSPRITELMRCKFYDTAVREGCVSLEHSIKKRLDSDTWGSQLTDDFCEYIRREEKVLESWLRAYSQELRTIFKFIRNLYMHNLVTIDESTAMSLLFRISRVKTALAV